MERLVVMALTFCAALLYGGHGSAQASVTGDVLAHATKKPCTKDAKGKCAKPAAKTQPKKRKPIAKVPPRIPKNYTPPSVDPKFLAIVTAYKECMYGAGDPIERALNLNLAPRDDPALGGSPEKLGGEVCLADALGLTRYATIADIASAGKAGELVSIVDATGMAIADGIPPERRYARPWVRDYLALLARDMDAHFTKRGVTDYTPLRVSSLVRSYRDQRRQWNSPASCKTEICSTHTTGSALDISNSRFHVGTKEREWIRERLLEDRRKGKIVMIEEWFPPHFHIFVLPPEFVPDDKTKGSLPSQ